MHPTQAVFLCPTIETQINYAFKMKYSVTYFFQLCCMPNKVATLILLVLRLIQNKSIFFISNIIFLTVVRVLFLYFGKYNSRKHFLLSLQSIWNNFKSNIHVFQFSTILLIERSAVREAEGSNWSKKCSRNWWILIIVRQMFLVVRVEVSNREGKEKNNPKPKREEISTETAVNWCVNFLYFLNFTTHVY